VERGGRRDLPRRSERQVEAAAVREVKTAFGVRLTVALEAEERPVEAAAALLVRDRQRERCASLETTLALEKRRLPLPYADAEASLATPTERS
jgi:hypothetical protein